MKNILAILFLLTFSFASGQDLLFTQYNASPLSLNPAMTGVFDGSVRAATNYRNQWSQILDDNSYKGFSFSVDKKIKLGGKNYFGIGVLGIRDVAGELSFTNTQGNLSFSYMHSIGRSKEASHYIIVGQNIGFVNKRVDLTDARWPTQVINGVFDPTLPGEDAQGDLTHLDLNSGLMWVSQFASHNSFYGGLAIHHLNKPNASFLNNPDSNLYQRLTIHAGGEFSFTDKMSIVPQLAYNKQGPHELLNIGSGLRSYFSSRNSFAELGVKYLLANNVKGSLAPSAVAFYVRSYFKGISIGFSYELVVNELSPPDQSVDSLEFSLGYIFGRNPDTKRVMPRF